MASSIKYFSPSQQKQYTFLKIYSFLYYSFVGFIYVYQPFYFISIGVPLWGIFLNASFAALLSLFVENWWAKKGHQTKKKPLIMLGISNLGIIGILTFFVQEFWQVLLLTVIKGLGPNADVLLTVMVYDLSDSADSQKDLSDLEKKYEKINLFARYRRFGSMGWAIFVPLIGFFLNTTGLGINFLIAAAGMFGLVLLFHFSIDECAVEGDNGVACDSDKNEENTLPKSNIIQSLVDFIKNPNYLGFLISILLIGLFSKFQSIAINFLIITLGIFWMVIFYYFSKDEYGDNKNIYEIYTSNQKVVVKKQYSLIYFLNKLFKNPIYIAKKLFNNPIYLAFLISIFLIGLRYNFQSFTINYIFIALGLFWIVIFYKFSKRADVIEKNRNVIYEFEQLNISQKSSLSQSLGALFKNPMYVGFIISAFLYNSARSITFQVQGLFYNVIAQNNYFIIGMIYSIAAIAEWPTMNLVAKYVKRWGWEKMTIISYLMDGLKLFAMPFLLIYQLGIEWGYFLQIFTGIILGINLPSTTFGITHILDKKDRTIGQSFNSTTRVLGALFGNIVGFLLSRSLVRENDQYLGIYMFASFFAFFSGFIFYNFITRRSRKLKKKSLR